MQRGLSTAKAWTASAIRWVLSYSSHFWNNIPGKIDFRKSKFQVLFVNRLDESFPENFEPVSWIPTEFRWQLKYRRSRSYVICNRTSSKQYTIKIKPITVFYCMKHLTSRHAQQTQQLNGNKMRTLINFEWSPILVHIGEKKNTKYSP